MLVVSRPSWMEWRRRVCLRQEMTKCHPPKQALGRSSRRFKEVTQTAVFREQGNVFRAQG